MNQIIKISEFSKNYFKPEIYKISINSKNPIIPQILKFLNSEFPDYHITFKINKNSIKFHIYEFSNNNKFFKTENYFKYNIKLNQEF